MYVSYSGYKLYSTCPRAYWHSYVNKTPPPERDNCVNSLYGSVVGTMMEDFYTQNLWRDKNPEAVLTARIEPTYDKIVQGELGRNRILQWKSNADARPNYYSREELLADVRDTVPRALRIVRHYRLAGPKMEAEVKLDSRVGNHTLGGRADFIIQRTKPHHDLVILDGKGSKHRGDFVDPRQLRWYGMLYALRNNGAMPDKLGFVYWRFDPPESMDWVEFSKYDLDELLDEVVDSLDTIESLTTRKAGVPVEKTERSFRAKPSKDNCRFCVYMSLCPEGQNFKSTGV